MINALSLSKNTTLFLLPSSRDTVIQQERASPSVPSYLPMKSDWSMELPVTQKKADNTPEEWYINISISVFT